MKMGRRKQIGAFIVATAFLTLILLAPSARALAFNATDASLSYIVVSGNPDVAKPGETVSVSVTGKLAIISNVSDTLHITIYVDSLTQPSQVISEGDLVLSADATERTAHISVAIPTDVINNTYLYMSLTDNSRTYSKISLSLIQNPTYFDLQVQNSNLQTRNNELESSSGTLNFLLYTAIFVAVIFIITTVYILSLTFRSKRNKKEPQTEMICPQNPSAEP
jgi:preprotein translocase subunit SecG